MKLHLYRLCRVIVSLTMIFCLLFALCVPSHAVVGVDDAILAGLIAVLGSMGMDFFAQGLDRSGVIDEVVKWAEDNIGLLPDRVELALVAPNVLSVGGVLWNYAVQCADWFKSKFPSGSGSDNLVSAGSSLNGFPLYSLPYQIPYLGAVWVGNHEVVTGESYYEYFVTSSGDSPVYAYFMEATSSSYFRLRLISSSSFSASLRLYSSPGVLTGSLFNDKPLSVSSFNGVYICDLYHSFYNGRELEKSFYSYPVLAPYLSDSDLAASFSGVESSSGSLDLVGTDVASPEPVQDNKSMYLALPSSFGSLPEFVDRVFDGVDSDSEAGPLQSDYSSQLSDLIDVNGGIFSNTNSISQSASGILSGVQALVADLVGFIGELPGYIGSLSGKFLSIWHYVVDWVNSLRPFLNSMLSVWSNLPYAMVLPVYATAVIVIVLGLYKRFFM